MMVMGAREAEDAVDDRFGEEAPMSTQGRTRGVSNRETEKLVAKFDRMLRRSGDALVKRFGEERAAGMRLEMRDEYRRLIPDVPYIGGRRNMFADHLTMAPYALAIYRVVVGHGGSLVDTGELMHQIARVEFGRVPRVLRPWMARVAYRRRRLKAAARWSQARRYPEDFVFEFVEGDGETFDFGIDFTECAYQKYLHAHGADELTPYGCDCDYVMAELMGIGMQRTKTLAWGCDRCDFRFSKTGVTSAPWPPKFVERTCGEPETQ
jgi:hypothetical protein